MKSKRYHFIGIGGIGMSALARILLDKKISVSGSDLSQSSNLDALKYQGAKISTEHSAKHITQDMTVVYSSRISQKNPELQRAAALNCPLLHRSELLSQLMQNYQKTIAVAGTHGKTTTTSLLASILMENGSDPTFAIGGMLQGINGRLGTSDLFVAEVDESDGSFLKCFPHGAIVTNVESEHLAYFKTEDAIKESFCEFISHVTSNEFLFYCGDDPILQKMGRGTSYGFQEHNDVHISRFQQEGWKIAFDLEIHGSKYSQIEVPLVGEHNALNAAAVFALALRLDVPEAVIRRALLKFPGVTRRSEKKAERSNVLFLDDYGHHPTEIRATLKAIKNAVRERRLLVIFQPHRFSRIRDHLSDFAGAFEWADEVYITDVYASGEDAIQGITAQTLVDAISQVSHVPVSLFSQAAELTLRPHDVVLTMGAGDIDQLHEEFLPKCPVKKFQVGLIFGGLSCEHEISLRSGRFVSASLNTDLYDVTYFGIDKQGLWVTGPEANDILQNHKVVTSKNACHLLDPKIAAPLQNCDLFLPILHGTNGEDGTIQGFFEMLGKPYIGPDHRAAAISMDKVLTKKLAASSGVPTPAYTHFCFNAWLQYRQPWLSWAQAHLKLPIYVKPVHLGSSVGISKVEHWESLEKAIDYAFGFDVEVMLEEGKEQCQELEFAVLGNPEGFGANVPAPGEKLASGEFVDYEKKYSAQAVSTTVDAKLTPELVQKGRELAIKAYEAVKASGMMRVDFLLDPSGNFWFFELNAIPGLTPLSLFPKIWKREGVESQELINKLIIFALQKKRQKSRHLVPLLDFFHN